MTVRPGSLFSSICCLVVEIGGCSGGAPARRPSPAPALAPAIPDATVVDAPPPLARRGEACGEAHACRAELACAPDPGGYCSSACGLAGTACGDGTCVATARSGERCLASCTSDADCRSAEGYLCDPQWRACLIPNTAVIVPRRCPGAARTSARDPSFGPSAALSSANTPGLAQLDPSAVLTDTGDLLAVFGARRGVGDPGELGAALVTAAGVTPAGLPATAGDRAEPQLARDRKGILYAVWLAVEGRHREISLARSRDQGRTWTGPDRVDAADCTDRDPACLDRPMIAVGVASPSTGNELIYVLYAAGGGIRVATSHDEGATFRAATTALVGHHGDAVIGADGRLRVIALDPGTSVPGFGSADHRIVYTVSADGAASFAKPIQLSGRDEVLPFFASNPSLAVDSRRGYVYAAYVRGGRDAVWDLVILTRATGARPGSARGSATLPPARSTWCRTWRSIRRRARSTSPGTTTRARRAGSPTRRARRGRRAAPSAARSTTTRSRR